MAFQDNGIRRVFHKDEWWFSVKDVIEALVDTKDGTDYIGKLRKRDPGLDEGYRQIVETLEYDSQGGRQKTNFVNIEGIFRIMQSVPMSKPNHYSEVLSGDRMEPTGQGRPPLPSQKHSITGCFLLPYTYAKPFRHGV